MVERIEEIEQEALARAAAADSTAALEEVRVRYLGRKAELTSILRGIGGLEPSERGPVGGAANRTRKAIEALIDERLSELESAELEAGLAEDRIDVTLPGSPAAAVGHLHPITRTVRARNSPRCRCPCPSGLPTTGRSRSTSWRAARRP